MALRESAGPPRFRLMRSSRATFCDPGRFQQTSPLAVCFFLSSGDATPSSPACRNVSRLDSLSGVRLPLAACEFPCVCFPKVVRPSSPAAAGDSPGLGLHSGLGGWLGPTPRFVNSESLLMLSSSRACSVLEGLSPSASPVFSWRTAFHFLAAAGGRPFLLPPKDAREY